jgi:hypothetical protein
MSIGRVQHPRRWHSLPITLKTAISPGVKDAAIRAGTTPLADRASKARKRVREELVAVDCRWWMARSARAALVALHRSGVEFRGAWEPPADLRPWEGPFDGSEKRLPQHPAIAARQRQYARRWRERQRVRELAATD